MPDSLARLLSYVFHPLLMPLYGIMLLFYTLPEYGSRFTLPGIFLIYGIVIVTTIILPVITVWGIKSRGGIDSFEMRTSEERRLPFLATAFHFLVGYYLLKELNLPGIFYILMMGATTALILAIFINLVWKISIHLIGVGGIVGALFGLMHVFSKDLFLPLVLSVFISGMVGTARLSLGEHSPSQVYCGFGLGFACEYLLLYFW